MQDLLGRRVVLITGKGGVGRSTLTAAVALAAKEAGKRVLIAEVADDSGGNSHLAQLFGLSQLPRTRETLAPGISGSQLRSDRGAELFLTSVLRVSALAKSALEFEPLKRLFFAVPSLRELGVFYHLLSYLKSSDDDLMVIDMPATGHTLALTGLPKLILGLVSRGPIADAIREGQSYLNDPNRARAYVVTLPEELPVSETLELLEGLERTSVATGGIFVNRVPQTSFSAAEIAALEGFLATQPLYGEATFHRLKEAQRALERLRQSTSVPLMEIAELDKTGADLAREISHFLATAVFQ